MKGQMEQRLIQLKMEFESGRKMLSELEAKQENIRHTLLRISGAIQILEEELARENELRGNDAAHQVKSDEPATAVVL